MKKRNNDMINRIYIIRYLFTACSVYLFIVAEGHVKCLAIYPYFLPNNVLAPLPSGPRTDLANQGVAHTLVAIRNGSSALVSA